MATTPRPEAATPTTNPNRWWWLRSIVHAALTFAVGLGLIWALGFAQRRGWIEAGAMKPVVNDTQPQASEHTCPMHPQIRQPESGRCPICSMELVSVATGEGGTENQSETSIAIDPVARRVAGIQTIDAERTVVERTIRAPGLIRFDESRYATIAAYVGGRIEEMFADYTGVEVAKGDHLFVLYSPALYAAQGEYLESLEGLRNLGSTVLPEARRFQRRLVDDARQRLLELGMTEEQVATLDRSGEPKTRLTTYTPIGGTVVERMGLEGQYVKVGDPIYTIADLSTVWLMLELFPEDASAIRYGQRVTATIRSIPGRQFEGRVAFVDPVVDPQTRTVSVRVEMPNPNGHLRPGDYATAKVTVPIGPQGEVYDAELAGKWISPMHPQIIREEPGECPVCGMDLVSTAEYGYAPSPIPRPEAVVVPRRAVLMAGDHSVAYVETEPGRFEIRALTLGPVTPELAVVLEGIDVGEQVALEGNFLIDSQMQLAGNPSVIDPTRALLRTPAHDGDQPIGPLEVAEGEVQTLAGEAGRTLERLYGAYLNIQATLAADRPVVDTEVNALITSARYLADDDVLPRTITELAEALATDAETLIQPKIAQSREAFKPISDAAIRLASKFRGVGSSTPLIQYYCPMVVGGGGDWLQADEDLRNPYYGAEMLTCGAPIRTFAIAGPEATSGRDD